MERPETTTESLLGDESEAITSLDELREQCLPTLTARIWETCCWPEPMSDGWKVADYNFIVISFSPPHDDRASLYVQFWSEPLEPVLAEVCSGNWNLGAVKYVRHPQRQALEELGFTIGGQAGNFRKEVVIRSADEAEQVASETLSILFRVFQYRGQAPLSIECYRGERATHGPVHSALTPEDFIKLALEAGFLACHVPDEHDARVIALGGGSFRSLAMLGSLGPNSHLFASVLLRAAVRGRDQTSRCVGRIDRGLVPAGLIEGNDRRVCAQTTVAFEGGPW